MPEAAAGRAARSRRAGPPATMTSPAVVRRRTRTSLRLAEPGAAARRPTDPALVAERLARSVHVQHVRNRNRARSTYDSPAPPLPLSTDRPVGRFVSVPPIVTADAWVLLTDLSRSVPAFPASPGTVRVEQRKRVAATDPDGHPQGDRSFSSVSCRRDDGAGRPGPMTYSTAGHHDLADAAASGQPERPLPLAKPVVEPGP